MLSVGYLALFFRAEKSYMRPLTSEIAASPALADQPNL